MAGKIEHHGNLWNALTELEQRFLEEYVENGGDHILAALAAGYGKNSATQEQRIQAARVRGYQLIHTDRVLAALNEEAGLRLRSGALLGASVLVAIAKDEGHKDRFKAAKELLGHNGFNIISEHKVTVEHTPTDQERIANIIDMAKKLGVDPRQFLGAYGVVTDAEFKVITHEKVRSAAGLEDLLEDTTDGDPD